MLQGAQNAHLTRHGVICCAFDSLSLSVIQKLTSARGCDVSVKSESAKKEKVQSIFALRIETFAGGKKWSRKVLEQRDNFAGKKSARQHFDFEKVS